MAQRNLNIRKLAIAYAQGKVDIELYRKLRTAQLSALDFHKEPPQLPDEYAYIEIPTINIDPPQKASSAGKRIPFLAIIIIITISLLAAGAYFFVNPTTTKKISKSKSAAVEKPVRQTAVTLDSLANELKDKPFWSTQDIANFKKLWLNTAENKREAARSSDWFSEFEKSMIRQIKDLTSLQQANPNSVEDLRRLNELKLFYTDLKTG